MKQVVLLVLCLVSGMARAQPVHLLEQGYAEKIIFLDSFMSCIPEDSAFFRLGELEKWAIDKGDMEFAYECRLVALRKKHVDHQDERIEDKIADVALYANKNKLRKLEADALKLLGDYWMAGRKYGVAFEYDLASYNIFSGFSEREFPNKRKYLYVIATHYGQMGDRDNSFRLLKEAERTQGLDSLYTMSINNALGIYYRNLGRYDSARWYFQVVGRLAEKSVQPVWAGIAAGNIGICYFLEGNYAAAKPMLEKDITLSLVKNVQNAVRSMHYLAMIHFAEGERDKAEAEMHRALSLARQRPWWPEYKIARDIYLLLAQINAAKNDMTKAYLYGDSARVANDSFNNHFNALSVSKAHEKTEIVQRKLELERINARQREYLITRNSLLAIIILGMVIGLLLISRFKQRQRRLEIEKKSAILELQAAVAQLENFRQSIYEKNVIIEQAADEIARMKEGEMQLADEDTRARLGHTILLTEDQWEDFRIVFEKVHKGFFKRVKEKMPDLTPAELRFVALSKLKLSPKEMAAMLGISANSIRNYRHRLRKKLDMNEDASIEEIADAI